MPDSGAGGRGSGDPDTVAGKAGLRARLLAARKSLPAQVRVRSAERVQAALAELLDRLGAAAGGVPGAAAPGPAGADADPGAIVAGYQPMPTEPGGADLPALLARGLPPGGRLLLPVLLDDLDLDWTPYRPAGGYLTGAAPGPEPQSAPPAGSVPGPRVGVAAIARASLVVVPAVAVDRQGVRLGRGGGSYDRALARVRPGTEVVALLHDGELLDRVPAEPHDRRVRAAVTPADGLVRLPR